MRASRRRTFGSFCSPGPRRPPQGPTAKRGAHVRVTNPHRSTTSVAHAGPPRDLEGALRYIGSMKQKTSITLSEDLLAELDRNARPGESRSALIERVLRRHFRRRKWATEQARDVERLNAASPRLNAEMAEVLEFQAPWPEDT